MKRLSLLILQAAALSAASTQMFVYPRTDCVLVDYETIDYYAGHGWNAPPPPNPLLPTQNNYQMPGYAQFGYTSYQSTAISIPQGNNNIFVQDPQFRNQITSFSPGTYLNVFGTSFDPSIGLAWFLNGGFATVDPSMTVCPAMGAHGPLPAQLAPVGFASGQTVRLNILANRAGACSGTLSFVDELGNPVGPPAKTVSLSGGHADFLDLVGSTVITAGHHKLVQPRFSTASTSCQPSVEVFTSTTGVTVFSAKPQQAFNIYEFDMQGLSTGQTLRINFAAGPGQDHCTATIGFMDSNGAAVGGTASTALSSGRASWLDLPSTVVPGLSGWVGGRAQIRPVIHTVPSIQFDVNGSLINGHPWLQSEACFASAEIFDSATGLTRTISLPTVLP